MGRKVRGPSSVVHRNRFETSHRLVTVCNGLWTMDRGPIPMLILTERAQIRRQRRVTRLQPDFVEQLLLSRPRVLVSHQFQHGQEHAHKRRLVYRLVEQRGE